VRADSSRSPLCRHHWLLQSLAEAGTFPARCRRCGAHRRFPVTEYDDATLTLRLQDVALLSEG